MPKLSRFGGPPSIPPGIAPQRRPVKFADEFQTDTAQAQPQSTDGKPQQLHFTPTQLLQLALSLTQFILQDQRQLQLWEMRSAALAVMMMSLRHHRYTLISLVLSLSACCDVPDHQAYTPGQSSKAHVDSSTAALSLPPASLCHQLPGYNISTAVASGMGIDVTIHCLLLLYCKLGFSQTQL